MDYLTYIQQTFQSSSIDMEERMKYAKIDISISQSNVPTYEKIYALFSSFPKRDDVSIFIKDDGESSIAIVSGVPIDESLYADFLSKLDEDSSLHVLIEINKHIVQNQMSVYCFQKFCADIINLSLPDVMLAFANLYGDATHLYFEVFDTDVFFRTGTMAFSSGGHEIRWELLDRGSLLDKCRDAASFYHQITYPLLPEDFNIEVDFASNPLSTRFAQLSTALSMAYLATTSSIVDGELRIQIIGQRTIDYAICLPAVKANSELYKIYRWIFTDGNAVDKALLARNSISAHCRFTEINNLDGKTFASIQANYSLYLKDHVTEYIELTNKMAEFIQEAINNISDCISQLLGHLKSNLLAVLSFVFTTLLANIVSDQPLDNIFTRDITIIMYIVLAGSLVYYVISVLEVNDKRRRMRTKYDNIVAHYRKILSEDEIQQITNEGKLLTDAQTKLRRGMIIWSIVWLLLLLAAFVVIDYIGDGPHIISSFISWVRFLSENIIVT